MKLLTLVFILFTLFLSFNSFAQEPGSGYALDFDGVNDYVSIPHSANLDVGSNPYTIEIWMNAPDINQASAIVYKRRGSSPYDVIGLSITNGINVQTNPGSGKKITFNFGQAGYLGSGFRAITTVNDIVDGQYHHICAVVDPSINSLNLYVDGILQTVNSVLDGSFPTNSNAYPYTFGQNNSGGGWCQVILDEVRIWNIALTQTQIQENMCKKLVGNETGLVAYYRMDEGADNTCTGGEDVCDETGNGNNGTKY